MQAIRNVWLALKRRFQHSEPEDPYAYVGAPRKPRPPLRGASAAEKPES
jgi:hypothetical protein